MPLNLDEHDQGLVSEFRDRMMGLLSKAHNQIAVAKRMHVLATAQRNQGRRAALAHNPFKGICEASGLPLAREHAELEQMEPELGYAGKLRWVCQRRNNSGKHSCGGC